MNKTELIDAIAASADIPSGLPEQLAEGASLIAPVGPPHLQQLLKITRTSEGFEEEQLGGVVFVPLLSGLE